MSGTKSFILFCLLKTVFCEELFGFGITMPDKIPALSGSCVLIPCSYQIEEAYKMYLQYHLTGVWIKGGISGSRVFNSDTKGPDNRWEIPGKLNQNNCTTILRNVTKSDNTTFHYRTEPIKYTYQKGAELTVTGRPWKPKLPPPAEVQEGTPVTLTCTAAAPCPTLPPALTWTPSLNDTVEQQEVENEDKTTSVSSVLTFTASHLHHELNITCTALYPLEQSNVTKSSERTVTIRVRYSPKNTSASVSSSGTILRGNSVTLTCSTNANPPVTNYTWFKVNGSQTVQTGAEQTLTFNIIETDSVQYYCEAQNEHGKENSTTVQLQAEYAPKISQSLRCTQITTDITCLCESHGNPLPSIEWLLSGQRLRSRSTDSFIKEELLENKVLRSTLTLLKTPEETDNIQCLSHNSISSSSFELQVHRLTGKCPSDVIPYTITGITIGINILTVAFFVLKNKRQKKVQRHQGDCDQYATLQLSHLPDDYGVLKVAEGKKAQDSDTYTALDRAATSSDYETIRKELTNPASSLSEKK